MSSSKKIKEYAIPEKYPKEWLVPTEDREGWKDAEKDAVSKVSEILGVETSTGKSGKGY